MLVVTFNSNKVPSQLFASLSAGCHGAHDALTPSPGHLRTNQYDNVDVVVSELGHGNKAQLVQEASKDPMRLLAQFLRSNGAGKLMDHTRCSTFMRDNATVEEEPNCAVRSLCVPCACIHAAFLFSAHNAKRPD